MTNDVSASQSAKAPSPMDVMASVIVKVVMDEPWKAFSRMVVTSGSWKFPVFPAGYWNTVSPSLLKSTPDEELKWLLPPATVMLSRLEQLAKEWLYVESLAGISTVSTASLPEKASSPRLVRDAGRTTSAMSRPKNALSPMEVRWVALEKSTPVTSEPVKASSPIAVTLYVVLPFVTVSGIVISDESPSHPITVALFPLVLYSNPPSVNSTADESSDTRVTATRAMTAASAIALIVVFMRIWTCNHVRDIELMRPRSASRHLSRTISSAWTESPILFDIMPSSMDAA